MICRFKVGHNESRIFLGRVCASESRACIMDIAIAPAAAYGEVLTGTADRELHDCGACGNPVRISIPRDWRERQRWNATGQAGG